MSTDQLFVFLILCIVVFLSEWLVRYTFAKHLGTALVAILLTALISNLHIIPSSSTAEFPVPVYDFIFTLIAPLSIIWLLLGVNLKDIRKAGLPMIGLFLWGSFATAIGVFTGMMIINGEDTIGPLSHAIGGMLTGTYTGGSVNFNAVAIHYNVMQDGVLFAGTTVVDNIITAFWMVMCIAIPKVWRIVWPSLKSFEESLHEVDIAITDDSEKLNPTDLSLSLILGIGGLLVSVELSEYFKNMGWNIPSMLILTVIALILAQIKVINKLKGPRLLGLFSVYLFLSVIGAYCDLEALSEIGSLGFSLMGLTLIIVLIHGVLVLGLTRLLKLDIDIASVASQANIGGAASALALARSLGRKDLVLPGVLVGSLGTAIGTFLGFWVAGILQ